MTEIELKKDEIRQLDSYITNRKYNNPGWFAGNTVCFKWQGYIVNMTKVNGRWIKKIEKE